MSLNPDRVRQQFPALMNQAVFFDNPGGTQIAKPAIDRMNNYLVNSNANQGGAFATSHRSDAIIAETRQALVDFFNANRTEEIVFGANMTSLTFHFSRILARTWKPGDTIVLTRLDHDANVTPWVMAAEEHGCQVLYVDFNLEDGTLDLEQLEKALEAKPRLLAVGYASNALGTINPLKEIVNLAHAVEAMVYVDAVHYVPHGSIDVQELDCDFLVCSAYKFFGPHVGILYGRYELLAQLEAYKVRPAPSRPPGKFETGTQNHEAIAGVLGALEYFEWVGENFSPQSLTGEPSERRSRLVQALLAIQAFESDLSRILLEVLEETPGVTIYGLRDYDRLAERVPTYSFNLEGNSPQQVAEELGKRGIYVWDGNYYAISVTESLGVEASGGMVRVGPVHYNTVEEIERFGEALREIASSQKSG
jgi:cysteine desulfurase family protein (TIGR01976 family)